MSLIGPQEIFLNIKAKADWAKCPVCSSHNVWLYTIHPNWHHLLKCSDCSFGIQHKEESTLYKMWQSIITWELIAKEALKNG